MSDTVAFIWDEAFTHYDFGPEHPLKPVRVKLAVELARALGVLDAPNASVVAPKPATIPELQLVHTSSYINAIEQISATCISRFGNYGWGVGIGDNPAFRGMHEASALVAGGSLEAARLIARGTAQHTFNPAGGLHHAMADRASGFCIYNDPAIAIAWLLEEGAERITYVDVDVHHGDGVQDAFFDDPRVLTISLHESGEYLFPGTGFPSETGASGTSVNVALPPHTDDEAYQRAFDEIVPVLIETFKPTILVTQLGCDTHATDPLAHLNLTTRSYEFLARSFHDLAHKVTSGKWLAVGGGGYEIYKVVPRAWTVYAAEIAGIQIDDRIPSDWIELARSLGASAPPEFMWDRYASPANDHEGAERAVEMTKRAVFPFFGL
ncbi:MAG: acetoin utilization protein AcuC [Actinomycetota bacterium]